MNTSIAALIAADRTHGLVRPALPHVPVRPKPQAPPRAVRARTASALRHVAARIEPACG